MKIIYFSLSIAFLFNTISGAEIFYDAILEQNQTMPAIITDGFNPTNVFSLPNDAILVSGYTVEGNLFNSIVARFNQDGTSDSSYGTSGATFILLGESQLLHDSAINAAQELIAVGQIFDAGVISGFVTKLLPDGSPDLSFGNSGAVIFTSGDAVSFSACAITPDQKIVAVGTVTSSGTQQTLVIQLNSDGSFDTTFNGTGIVILTIGIMSSGFRVAVDAVGSVYLTGESASETGEDMFIQKLTNTGIPDALFGSSGLIFQPASFIPQLQPVSILIQQSTGRLLTVSLETTITGDINTIVLANLLTTGDIDTTFNSPEGFIRIVLPNQANATSAIVDSTDNIIIAGGTSNSPLLFRLTANGLIDTSFGDNGFIINQPPNISFHNAVTIEQAGTILAAGSLFVGNSSLLRRYFPTNVTFISNLPLNNRIITGPLTIQRTASLARSRVNITVQDALGNTILSQQTITDENGIWLLELPPLVNGEGFIITTDLLDRNNNVIATSSATFDVIIPDAITIIQPVNNGFTTSQTFLISGSSSEANATVNIFIDADLIDTTITDLAGNWQTIINSPVIGTHDITTQLMDGATVVAQDTHTVTIFSNIGATGTTGATGPNLLANDYLFAYTTSNANVSTPNTFQNIIFTNPTAKAKNWIYDGLTNSFSNPNSGRYLISYVVNLGLNFFILNLDNINASTQLAIDGVAIDGTITPTTITQDAIAGSLALLNNSVNLTNECIIDYIANQSLALQFTANTTATSLNTTGIGNGNISAELIIFRLE